MGLRLELPVIMQLNSGWGGADKAAGTHLADIFVDAQARRSGRADSEDLVEASKVYLGPDSRAG